MADEDKTNGWFEKHVLLTLAEQGKDLKDLTKAITNLRLELAVFKGRMAGASFIIAAVVSLIGAFLKS